jgi:hypothetical protein
LHSLDILLFKFFLIGKLIAFSTVMFVRYSIMSITILGHNFLNFNFLNSKNVSLTVSDWSSAIFSNIVLLSQVTSDSSVGLGTSWEYDLTVSFSPRDGK